MENEPEEKDVVSILREHGVIKDYIPQEDEPEGDELGEDDPEMKAKIIIAVLERSAEKRREQLKKFENLRDTVTKEGIPIKGKHGTTFYNYDGAYYCTEYPFVIQTGGVGLPVGKFKIYGIEPEHGVYVDLADVPSLFDFIDTFRESNF